MPISSLRLLAAGATVAGGLAIAAGPATAQTCYPPSATCVTTTSTVAVPRPTLKLSITTVVRGQTIGAIVTGFKPGTAGIFTVASVEQQIGSFTASATGTASTSVTIPTDIPLGGHTVFAKGTALDGTAGVASEGITVVASQSTGGSTGGRLARTGIFVVPTALIGVGLVAGGLALRRSSKRGQRRRASTETA